MTGKLRTRERSRFLAPILAAFSLVAACRGKEPPVGSLAATPASIRLPYPDSVPVTFEWSATAPLGRPGAQPSVFVHLLDRPHHVLRTFDHELPGTWKPGQPLRDVFDVYQSALGPPLPPGRYFLTAGLYDPQLGYRWPLQTGGSDVTGRREYWIADVEVPAGRVGKARYRLEGNWSGSDPGKGRQVLARRWLTGPGNVVLETSPRGEVARLAIRVMEGRALAARVTAPCSVSARELPAGARWLEVGPPPGSACAVRFEPTDTYGNTDPAPARWLAIEVLAFRRR